MNWKNEAMEKLRRYDAMRNAVKNIPLELERLEKEAAEIWDSKLKAPSDALNAALLENQIQRKELCRALDMANGWIHSVEGAMSTLTPEEKLVLHRLYLFPQRGNVSKLCQDLCVEQSSIYRKRDKALYRFTVALYGTAET